MPHSGFCFWLLQIILNDLQFKDYFRVAVDYICFIDNGLENEEIIFQKCTFNIAGLYLIMFDKEILYSTLRKTFSTIILY